MLHQTWGIEEVNSERRYVRHMYMKGPKGEEVRGRLVYNYGELPICNLDSKPYLFILVVGPV